MRILAIDTATQVCGVALTEANSLVAEFRLNRRNLHNEALVQAIQNLLQGSGLALDAFDAVAVSEGPGSFTGLRIGFAVAKGIAFSCNMRLATVNSLDAFAYGAHFWPGEICVAIKARESECYLAKYRRWPTFEIVTDYQIAEFDELAGFLNKDTLFLPIPVEVADRIEDTAATYAPEELLLSSAFSVARLGYQKVLSGELTDPDRAEPFYLKDFTPKRKRPLLKNK